MRKAPLAAVKDDLPKFLDLASKEQILITKRGKPAGVLIGFADEEDWLDHVIENHPEFLKRVAKARKSLREGKGVRMEDLKI